MKNYFLNIAALSTLVIVLAGCGGGGNYVAPPLTKGAVKVYLFGTMSSTSRVATLHSEMTVPDGIMVNYSSPPGATTGKFPLRSGSILPSGPVTVSQSDISADYNLSDRKLSIDYINTPDFVTQARKNIRSGTAGDGVEVATVIFNLKTADVLPVLPTPWEGINTQIGEETSSLSIIYATGLKLNFVTSFSP